MNLFYYLPAMVRIQMVLVAIGCAILSTSCRDRPDEIVAEPVELNISTGYGNLWGQAEKAVFERFEENHPFIQIKSRNQDLTWQDTLSQSPLPDLLFGEAGYDLLRVPQQNQLSNLTDLWQQANWDETFPTSLKQLSAVDGKQFFLPMVINWVAIYYNIEVFQKYNITPPQTWDEFLLVCDTLQLEGVTPLAFGPVGWTGTYWFDYLNLRLNGADFHRGLLMGQERFDDDRVRNVFEAWRTLFERGCFGENMLSMSSTDSRLSIIHDDDEQLSKQKTAMTLVSSWEKGTLPEKWQNEIDFFRFPFIDPSVPLAELVWSYGYAMPIGVDDVDEAVEFLTYMSSVDTQTILAQGLGPTAIATQPNIDADVLQPSQIKGRDLVNEADDAVIVQLWSLPSAMMMASEQALWLFVHEPENIDAVLLTLEEGRQNALKQGVFQ